MFLLCLELKTSTIRSRIKLSRKQSQKLHVLARFLNSATKLSTDSVGSLSLILKQYRSQISLSSPMQCFSIFSHYHAPISRVLPLGVVECFDDFQRIISDRMFEHRQLKLRGFPIQTRNDKIIVTFLLPKLPVFGNFSTIFQVKVLRRSNPIKVDDGGATAPDCPLEVSPPGMLYNVDG